MHRRLAAFPPAGPRLGRQPGVSARVGYVAVVAKQVSRLAAWKSLHHLPGSRQSSGLSMQGTPLTVAGAARALNPSSLSIPVRGTCCVRIRCSKKRFRSRDSQSVAAPERQSNSSATVRTLCVDPPGNHAQTRAAFRSPLTKNQWVKREVGETHRVIPALPPQR
jgi:hypothetical protein